MQIQRRVAVVLLVVFDLLADVLFDLLLIETECSDEVASGPEFFLGNGFLSGELIVNANGALSLEEAEDTGDTVFRWDFEHHMDMVGLDRPLDDLNLLLSCEFPEDPSEELANGAEKHLLAVLRSEDHVVSAVPPCVGLGMECVIHDERMGYHPFREVSRIQSIANAGERRTPWSRTGGAGRLLRVFN